MLGMSPLVLLMWALGAMLALYLAREPAHRAFNSLGRIFHRGFRLAGRSLRAASQQMRQRNREVLLSGGMEHAERELEREFHRVHGAVMRDLSAYPVLHRKLSEHLSKIEENYAASSEVPPAPPAWVDAVGAVAQIPARENPVVADILADIHDTLEKGQKEATAAFRKSASKRHKLLERMRPHWRKLSDVLSRVGGLVEGLDVRSQAIDVKIQRYEEVRAGSDPAVRALMASSLTQFVIAGIVVMIAMMGGFINFNLIALPMSEMVGGGSYIGPLKTSDVAGLVIILVEISMGIFLMESLRITRLFPIIGSLDDKMRKRMAWASFGLLLTLACVEASLAYMRDLLAADREALAAQLAGVSAAPAEFRWIPAVGQMVMGFILPFALTFVAVPLESFIHAGRTVLGILAVGFLDLLAILCRMMASLCQAAGHGMGNIYDMAAFLPLGMERLIRAGVQRKEKAAPAQAPARKPLPATPPGAATAGNPQGGGMLS